MSEKKTNRGWSNLQPKKYSFANRDKDELREISKKGAQRMLEVKEQRRTAKQCLADILSLEATDEIIAGADLDPLIAEQLKQYADRITMYDLINLVAVGQAAGGNMRAAEYCRDTIGDMPVKQMSLEGLNIMTEEDRMLMEQIAARLNNPDITVVADMTTENNTTALSDKAAAGQEDNKGEQSKNGQ